MIKFKTYNQFVNESDGLMMFSIPADGKKSNKEFNDKQKQLGYYPKAVSAEVGGPGNPGEAEEVEEDTPTMLSQRLGDIEPDGSGRYPSQGGQDMKITQPGSVGTDPGYHNMRGEPKLTNLA